jgi:hypothetical protein
LAQAAGFSLHAGVLAEAERRGALTWAKRLRRVFRIDIETCCAWGAAVRVIASIEDPGVLHLAAGAGCPGYRGGRVLAAWALYTSYTPRSPLQGPAINHALASRAR